MERDLLIRRAATAATIACVAVVAGSVLALAVPKWRRALGMAPADKRAYAVGDRVDVARTIYASAPLTLLLFSRSECSACQGAKPALASLLAGLRNHPAVDVRLVVSEGTQADERRYLHELGLAEDCLAGADFSALRLQRVPTAVLVDRQGEVRYSVEGPPTGLDQAELVRIAASAPNVR